MPPPFRPQAASGTEARSVRAVLVPGSDPAAGTGVQRRRWTSTGPASATPFIAGRASRPGRPPAGCKRVVRREVGALPGPHFGPVSLDS